MAPQRPRTTRRTTRKRQPAETAPIEEFDREAELAEVDFGDEEAPPRAAAVEPEPAPRRSESASRRSESTSRRSEAASRRAAKVEDDFGADIVSDDRDGREERDSREERASREERESRDERDDRGHREVEASGEEAGESDRPTRSEQGGGGGEGHGGDDEHSPKRGRRRRRRGRGNREGQPEQRGGGGGGGGYQQRGRYEQQPRGGRGNYGGGGHGGGGGGGGRHDRNRQQQGRGRYQKAPVGESHEPPVMSGTFEGVLELHPKRYGFLRTAANNYGALDTDPFVSSTLVEKYGLREGIKIVGEVGPGVRGQGPRLLEVTSIDGRPPEEFDQIKHFDHLTPINPFEQIKLETGPQPVTMRVMDLLTPIGKGQRALIVAPPRSGKTMLLQDIANSVSINHPEIHLIVLLIDERPEEVTEMQRMVRGEVIASSMDRDVESHVRISQLVIERGKRIAEAGGHCFILMDSITRCARAFNKWVGGGRDAKIQTGGLDVRALEIPRKMFGTARRFDEGGSLTVCATALIDTGSRMDDAIFQEFKGTGNMELVLSRDLADRRIWPSIDISKSGTRREEKLMEPGVLEGVTMLRRALVSMSPVDAMVELTKKLAQFPTNKEFLERVRQVL